MCKDPGLTPSDLRGRWAALIAERGWVIQFVEPEDHHPSLTYTIGLTDFDLPELLAHGLSIPAAGQLNVIAQDCVDGLSRAGSTVQVGSRPFRLEPHADISDLRGALSLYGSSVRALWLRPLRG